MDSYAARVGFTCTKYGNSSIKCNRFGSKDSGEKRVRNYHGGQLKCGCDFSISVRPSSYIKKVESNSKRGYRSRPNFNSGEFVTIIKASLVHTGGCQPGPSNHVMTKSRAGKYVENITDIALFQLCNAKKNGTRLTTSVSVYIYKFPGKLS